MRVPVRVMLGLMLAAMSFAGAWLVFRHGPAHLKIPSGPLSTAQRIRVALSEIPQDGLSHEVAMEDPSGEALLPLYRALRRAERRQGRARVLFFGGSHTAGDEYTGVIRRYLQAGYGNGGHGFVLPVPTYPGFFQEGISIEEARGFVSVRPAADRRNIDLYGISGIRFDTGPRSPREQPAGFARIESDGASFDRVRFWYLVGPRFGTFSFAVDDVFARVDSRAGAFGFGETVREIERGDHSIAIRAGARTKFFGLVLEQGTTGVIVDNLAVTGSKARHHLFWDEDLWRTMVNALAPDFIVLAYGNNEAEDTHLTFAEHRAQYREMLQRVRRNVPQAGCMVVGPGYRYVDQHGQQVFAEFTVEMAAAQRALAFEYGCAYFSTQYFQAGGQDGRRSLARWRNKFPIAWLRDDGVHWSSDAYHRFGEVMLRSLLRNVE